jgi:preprotein translocase subunit SecF
MNIIGRKGIFLGIAGVLVVASLVAVVLFGFRSGIDFEGGALWSLRMDPLPEGSALQEFFATDLGRPEARVTVEQNTKSLLVRIGHIADADRTADRAKLEARFGKVEELSFQSIGPSVGKELRKRSLYAIALVLFGISLYIAFAFRKVFRPVSSWTYGWITLLTLLHDVVIPAGMMAVLGKLFGIEIDTNFIVALLVVMGFSVHDTIVVFDRIRENLLLDRGRRDFGLVVNESVNQTIARSINTSLTLVIVLVALLLLGPASIFYFVLTLLVGVCMGTYSSIFVASPLLHLVEGQRAGK